MSRVAVAAWGVLVSWCIWFGAAAGISTEVPVPVGVTMLAAFMALPFVAAWASR